MQFTIDPSVFALCPGFKVGIVVVEGMDNGDNPSSVAVLREAEQYARSHLDAGTLPQHPKILDWRNAYAAFGANPKEFRSSVEAMLRRTLQGKDLPDISPAVNLYNAVSLRHVLPAGGDDLAKVEGSIRLARAHGGEPFLMLGGTAAERADPGEVIYRDDRDVLCRRWNWRQCDKTKITGATTDAWFMIEGLESTSREELQRAAEELASHLQAHCKAKTRIVLADAGSPAASLR